MKSIRTQFVFAKFVMAILLSCSFVFSNHVFAEGTPQVSPAPASVNGAALLSAPDLSAGPYSGAPSENRLRFTIANNATENLYFGFMPRDYDNDPTNSLKTNAYYRIFTAAGVPVGPAVLLSTTSGAAGFISTYNEAVAGPNIGGATAAGYNPITFNPTANGDYYMELFSSNDGGITPVTTVSGRVTFPLFDLTVSTAANVQTDGRIWSREWSFVVSNLISGTYENALTSAFMGEFYIYTPEQFTMSVNFTSGFKPVAYQLAANFTGVGNTGNFINDRRSVNSNVTIPSITNGYQVFLTSPDAAVFPDGTLGTPGFTSAVYGCPGNYFIPYYITQPGDLSFLLDLNGSPGYQPGTADRFIEIFGASAGNNVLQWDGLDGNGAAVTSLINLQVTMVLYQGRTNIPMIDAELNSLGLTVNGVFPLSGNRRLYWDDTQVSAFGTCAFQGENITTGGIEVSALGAGAFGPTHAWDGSNPSTLVPAPIGGEGSSTPNALCDDFGNNRTINTWFYATESTTSNVAMVTPDCDKDGDGIDNDLDLDDDNDGILDVTEHLGLPDPMADADGDNIPNFIDWTSPGFIDTNFDGVDDRYDADLDGIIDGCDLDSDNDGIPDNIEAQTTTGYVAPIGTYTNGVDDAYAGGLTPVNTDGTDEPDYLDLDSDNEGGDDTAEAGITLSGNDTDLDGLDDVNDATTDYSDPNGTYDNTQADNFPDADADVFTGGNVDWRDPSFNDIDNDGVADNIDLDDDNDGILDSIEGGPDCGPSGNINTPNFAANTNLVSGGASGTATLNNLANGDFNFVASVSGSTNWTSSGIQVQNSGTVGNYIFAQPENTDNVSTSNVAQYDITFNNPVSNVSFFIGGLNNTDQVQITALDGVTPVPIGPSNFIGLTGGLVVSGNTVTGNSTSGGTDPLLNTFNLYIPQNVTSISISSGKGDNNNGAVTIGFYSFSYCGAGPFPDFDNDSVPNYLDLDSDNDGIHDVVEAGGTDTDGNGTADDDDDNVNNNATNGIPTSAGAGTTPLDFGNNATPNYLNLDSDEDGCNDVIEAGFTDQNANGILGNNPVIVNGDGIVTGTAVTNGYTGTNVNVTTPGTPGSISAQPVNASVGISNDTTFSVTAAGSDLVYQWQISTNNGGSWTNLTNSGTSPQYSGVTTSTLSVDNVPFSSDDNQFRVLITSSTYLCTDLVSTPGVLVVDPAANIGITKTVNVSTPNVGANVIFTLVADNAGPSSAANVVVNDLLPNGYTFVSASPSAAYNSANGNWTVGTLASGGSSTLTITATVAASGPYQNCATISNPGGSDPIPGNNISCVSTTPVPVADLSITKVADNAAPAVGSNVTFTITATNAGPSNVAAVSVADALPNGYSLVSATPSTGTFSGGVWNTFGLNGTAPGNTATLVIVATVNASGSYANTATISSPISDPNTGNNSSTSTPIPVPQADLGVTKVVDNTTPFIGDDVTFTIVATNAGLNTALSATATDILPAGYLFVSSTTSTGTYNDVSGVWNIGNMANGASDTLTIVATVTAAGSYANTVTITSATADPSSGNNTATSTTVPVSQSDISISKSASSLTPDVGSIITFTIDVTNNGPSPATNVQVTDLLPNCYSYISFTTSANAGGTSYVEGTGLWDIGNMANGATYSLFIQALVEPNGNCANTATVTSSNDPNTVNNTSTVTPVPVPQTNLGVVKTATPTSPNVGGTVTFTIIVDNAGPSNATGVTLTDILPNGYTLSGVTPPSASTGTYDPITGIWNIGPLLADSNEILTVTATVNASGDYANTATVTGSENDPTPGNNTSTVIPGPTPQSNLSITKTANTSSPLVGGTITFTLTAANAGPSDATGVVVNDLLPTGYTYSTHATAFGNYDDATGIWDGFDLLNGGVATILIAATVDTSGIYQNCATIAATQNDPNNGNNTSCVTPNPVTNADLSVTKSVNDLTPNVGDTVAFTITVNNIAGPNAAINALVQDLLPSGYLFISENSPIGSYSSATGDWNIGTLLVGGSATLIINAQVLGAGPYANTAVVSSDISDPNPTNNSSTVTPTPVAVSDLSIVKVASDTTPNVGSIVTFTLTATNNGLSNATGVNVIDLLQSCYTYQPPAVANNYTPGTGVWNIGNIASGATEVLTINAIVNASGNCDNTATISGNEIDPDLTNNTSTISTVPVPQTNLGITKTVTPLNPPVGSNVIFTLTVTNNGPSDATGVIVNDTLPSGYTLVPSVPNTGTYNAATNIWSIGPLANGATATFNLEATVNVSGEYTNCAYVSGIEGDPATSNNTACASPVPSALSNLVINKAVNISSPDVGTQVIFTINATNVGPSDATTVVVNDPLPNGYTLDSAVTSVGSYTSPNWSIGPLANNSTETMLIYATVNPGGAYANTAIISADQTDPNNSNNTSTASTTPIPQTGLWVNKTVSSGTPNVGDTVVFTIAAGNYGPNNATGVLVQDQLPSGYTFVSATGGTYFAPNWLIGVLNAGFSDTLTVTAVINPTGNYANTAIISGNQVDPDGSDNTSTSTPVPVQLSNLSIVKTVSPPSPQVGIDDVTFTITVTNNGPNNATGVIVADTLPTGYTFVSAPTAAGSYDTSTHLWTIGNIQNGDSAVLEIIASVSANGTYINTATVDGDQVDPDPTDNISSVAPTPVPVSDLSISKTVSPDTAAVGDVIVFTVIATNNGPSIALGVNVTDTIPDGYSIVSSNTSSGTYNSSTGIWNIGNMPFPGTDTLTVSVTVLASGSYTNTASITGSQVDPNSSNNTATATPVLTNLPPVAVNDTIAVVEDIPTNPTQIVTTNDFDIDGNPLPIPDVGTVDLNIIAPNTQPTGTSAAGGVVNVDLLGNIIYTPPLNFNGSDSIQYTVLDDDGDTSNVAWIFFNVSPVNDPPVVINEIVTLLEDSTATGNILTLTGDNDPDGTPLVVDTIPLSGPNNGDIVMDSLGNFIYTPDSNFVGVDTVVFEVCDNGFPLPALCANDTLFLNVTNVNDPPVAVDDDTITLEDNSITFNILANDYDTDGFLLPQTLDLDLGTPGIQNTFYNGDGTWSVDTLGNLTFVPDSNFNGVTSIVYNVCDNDLLVSNNANVTINVIPDNDAPVTTPVNVVTSIGNPIPVNVGSGTTDPENNPLTYVYDTLDPNIPAGTVITVTGNGAIVVTPPANFGPGSFYIPFTVCDSSQFAVTSLCDTDSIFVNVVDTTGPNNPPVANNDQATIFSGQTATVNPLSNDFEVDNDPLTLTIGSPNTLDGVFTINPDNSVTYLPNDPNWSGFDSTQYVICDNGTPALCDSAYIVITVSPVVDTNNVAPIAVDDYATTTEDVAIPIVILGNDSDPNGDPLGTPTIIVNGDDGLATIDPVTGVLTYTPNPNFIGTDTITYVICDTGSPVLCDTADIVITVVPGNDAPTTSPVTVVTPLGTPVPVNVGAGTTDPELNPITYTYDTTDPSIPVGTTVTVTGNGTIVVTPPTGFGPGSFIIPFTVCDSSIYAVNVLCDTDTIFVNVVDTTGPGNNGPIANNDQVTAPVGDSPTVNVLGNDYDVDGDTLNVNIPNTTGPNGGTFTDNGDGTVTYTPIDPTFVGMDSVQYVICDTGIPVLCDTAYIVVTISPVVDTPNVAPIAVDDYATTDEDTPVDVIITNNDTDPNGDPLGTPTIISNGNDGNGTIDPVTGVLTYIPNPNFIGTDTITYVICDTGSPVLCDTADVVITVGPGNDAPTTSPITVVTSIGSPVPANVGAGTTDPELNPLTYTYDTLDPNIPAGTVVTVTGNGAIVITPPPSFGPGTFFIPFTVCDSSIYDVNVLCDTDTIYVVVVDTTGPGNNPPVANNDQVTVPIGQSPTVNVLGNDYDVDGDSLNVTLLTTVTPAGTYTDNGDGTVTFTPNPNFTGTDSTQYVICDTGIPVLCDTAYIVITISPVVDTPNVAPIATDDVATTNEDTPITIDVLANDTDPNGNPIGNPIIDDSTDNGTLTVDGNGDVIYVPNPNFNGTDTFTYIICDFGTPVLCDTAQVVITVLPINDTMDIDNEYDTIPLLGTVSGDLTDALGTVDDQDIDGNIIVNTTPLSGPNSGTIIINPDGTYTYTDTSGTPGNDTIVVQLCDDGTPLPAICINDTIFINVLPNIAPVVINANAATSEDVCITLDVLIGAFDPDLLGSIDSTTVDLDPTTPGIQDTLLTAGGLWTVDPMGLVTFCPTADSCGYTASANFTVNDNVGTTSNVGTINVFVVCVNDPPTMGDSILVTDEDVAISLPLDSLSNDVDGPVDPTTYDLDTSSTSIDNTITNSDGTWAVSPTGVLTFTPIADSCDYTAVLGITVQDLFGLTSNVGTVSIYVQCVNDAPMTDTVNVATPIDTPVGVNVAAGTSDPELNPLTYTYDTLGIPGTLVITGNGAVVFTPNPGFFGTVTIPFTVCDSSQFNVTSLCDSAAIVIQVIDTTGPNNNDPIANNDLITTPIGTTAVINPVGNDFDVDGDSLIVTFLNPGSTPVTTPGGTYTLNPDGTVTFVPNPTFTGLDSIPYSVCDTITPVPGCDTAFIYVTVSPVVDTNNLAPIATDDFGTTPEDSTIVIDILSNDSDPNGSPLDPPTIFSGPSNGTASIDPTTGSLIYTPDTGFIGVDTVVYVLCDTNGLPYCDTAMVIITVNSGNAPPTTSDITVITSIDTPVGVNVSAGTSDPELNPLTYVYDTLGIPGTLDSTGVGTVVFIPNPGYTGTFTIPFTVCDSSFFPVNILCDSGVITITVVDTTGGVNNPPVANNDLLTTLINVPVVVNAIGNDFDPDLDSLIITFTNTPGSTTTTTSNGGTATINPDGTVSYVPALDFIGIDSIPYSVCDTAIPPGCDTAFIIVTISPVIDTNNVAPAATDDYASTTINVPVTYPVTNNDTDPNGNGLNDPTIFTQGSNGNGSVNPGTISTPPTITYTPNPGFVGIDTVTYVICDNGNPVLCDTALYIITVILPNEAPSQGNELLSMSQCDTLRDIDVLANNIDPDGDSVLVSAFTPVSTGGGTVVLNTDGTLSYTPLDGFLGMDTVFYTVCDTFVPPGCVNDTLIIEVLADNDCDLIVDVIDIDDDNDGITDLDECLTANGACDTDGDGILDQYDLDSDNDGILDIVESGGGQWDTDGDGVIDSNIDTDNNGLMDVADPGVAGGVANPNLDTDGDGRPDFQDLDSDNDGIPDVFESGAAQLDADGDGVIDGAIDTDGDGIIDVADANNGGTANPNPDTDGDGFADNIDLDADNDGISDVVESGQPDTDGDGYIDAPANTDANNDGLADSQVGQNPDDFDNDSYPNYVDLDSDSDGIPDVIENGYADTDADGVVDNFTDANNNGWDDSSEGTPLVNSDTDPLPDYLDHDSDQDGIPDVVEGGQDDVDMDGWLDDLTDVDGNGWADNTEGAAIFDWDNDGTYDYLDIDSDDDGILDVIEGGFVDANNDGVIDNFTDPDNDGWDTNGIGWTVPDTDGDGIPDFRDIDSDGDGILDGPDDNYNSDCDNDGIPDWLDPDPCTLTVEIPDGFTPNGDGSNDFFVIVGVEQFPGNELIIYNRWGNIVFDAVDYDNTWQGTTNSSMAVGGDLLPTGTYYYVFDTKDDNVEVVTGFIYIQR